MIIEKSTAKDIPNIMAIIADAQKLLASLHIDQWQDGYPDTAQITKDILNQESYIVKNTTGEIVATFMFLLPESLLMQ
ncbi:hypothetical protein [Tenacibaculum sp. SG-28]|uniref:hypothetical protein n=1 Tax=Tenacibaculum sp. SG-28 TaxID=754426 RepID=UPI001E62F0A5|nr:hypothetical protein [Tenacibaculum sp. SG-28]